MKLHIKYDINICCKVVLQEQLDKFHLPYTITGLGEVEIKKTVSTIQYNELEASLKKYGIEIMDNPKNIFIQKIKDAITEMVYMEEELPLLKISTYLSKKLNKSYGHIANIFSEVTFTSIQNFIILQKMERVKQEIIDDKETLTEIAWKLQFSSVGHLCREFKKITGLTPKAFQQIIAKRKETIFNSDK